VIRSLTTVCSGSPVWGVSIALIVYQGHDAVLSAFAAGGLGLIWASLFHAVRWRSTPAPGRS